MTAWRFYLPMTHETLPRHVNSAELCDFPSDLMKLMERNAQLYPIKPEPRLNIKGTEYDPRYDVLRDDLAKKNKRNRGVPRGRNRRIQNVEDVNNRIEPQNEDDDSEPNEDVANDDDDTGEPDEDVALI